MAPRRRGLLVVLGGLVVALVVFVLVVSLGGPDQTSARSTAEAAAEAFLAGDVDEMRAIACERTHEHFASQYDYATTGLPARDGPLTRAEVTKVHLPGGEPRNGALVEIEIEGPAGIPAQAHLVLHNEDDSWCVSRIEVY